MLQPAAAQTLCRDIGSLSRSANSYAAVGHAPLHIAVMQVVIQQVLMQQRFVLHTVALAVFDFYRQPVTQRRYCGPVKRRQASQKCTDFVRHGARGARCFRGCASAPTCRPLPAALSTPPLA